MSQPTPVLLLAQSLGIGGCERDLARLALGLDRRRFLPHVGCFRPDGIRAAELKAAGVPIVHFPVTGLLTPRSLLFVRQFGAYCRDHKIGLLQAFDVPGSLFGVPAGRVAGIWSIASQLSYRTAYPRRIQAILRGVHKLAHAVVVNSQATGRHLVADGGVPERKVYLCYNGVDPDQIYPPANMGARDALPEKVLDGRRPLIGVVAALREEKQLEVLIDAFALVHRRHPHTGLLFVGGGALLSQLQARAAERGIDGAVHFEPTRNDVERWLRAIDIFVLPSRTESFSNAVLEALGSGCAVVTSAVGGLPEMVRPETTGLLFPPGDTAALAAALERFIVEPGLRERLGSAAARMVAAEFTMDRTVARMEALYTSLLAGRGIPAPLP